MMTSRPGRGRSSRMHYVNPRNEHDDRGSRPSTSRGGSNNYLDRFSNKKVTFKAHRGGNHHYRKSWDSKTELVRKQLDDSHISENQNRNGQPRNNSSRRSYPERNHGRGGGNYGNFRSTVWTLKESNTGWYSIYVPNLNNDCDEILKILQTYISPITFYPYNKQFFDNALRFVVDDYKIAKILHNTSYKITLRDSRKLVIKVGIYTPPRSTTIFTPVSNEIREKMVEVMATRYNPSTKSLDLSQFYACSLFTEKQLFVTLNRPAVLLVALNIVAQHTKSELFGLSLENNHIYMGEGLIWIRRLFPNLKVLDLAGNKFSDLNELNGLHGFSIEVINLSRNPVSDTEDKERYRQDVQQLFPMLNKLDNTELPLRYSAAVVGANLKMPVNLGNSFAVPAGHNTDEQNPVETLVKSFLEQYYERYDNKLSRQMVAEAYHEDATFTLSSFLSYNSKGNLSQYSADSRNLLKPDRNKKNRLIHKGRENVINFLDKLPKTKHDMGSFLIDVPAQLIQIVVNGVFAENYKENQQRPLFRSFCRAFSIVPFGNGWSILSDMLFVTLVNEEQQCESSKRFYVPRSKLPKKSNSPNSNNNTSMFMEDSEEMTSMESSSSYQQDTPPNYPPPQYQQTQFSTYQSPSLVEIPAFSQQQPPPYQASLQTPVEQNPLVMGACQQHNQLISSTEPVSFQSNSQQLNNSFYMYNNTTPTTFSPSSTETSMLANQPTTTFPVSSTDIPVLANHPSTPLPASSTHTPMLANQPSTEVSTNSNNNSDEKLMLIKNFSKESGMNNVWAKKCLEENDWNYTEAALCFSKLKPNIPPAAFT
ncbi:Hypothetical protein CINCED_3A015947 [Cinara cedri]|uniref:Uncharacterized protein n=1 Tax=Cinara cedri TaxID=506608 RepID=A0A5E4MBY7_9HEMI|nr:Hypothetical protein CINCED_3A015947 [Cinara cedri]